MTYIFQNKDWPAFTWNHQQLENLLAIVRHRQGRILGRMESLGFPLKSEANLNILTLDVIKSNEIEGHILDREQVRSSIARRLGLNIGGLIAADRHVEGVVEMILDATQQYDKPLTEERLFGWHSSLFPVGHSGIHKIKVGNWRDNGSGPMQVISGAYGKERIHYEAPDADLLEEETTAFLKWFNNQQNIDAVIKAAIAHLWFVTLHPFDDGNGRIARAIADMQLARAEESPQRFYSMSAQIRIERNAYYDILERTQKGSLVITEWLQWFLLCLDRALSTTENTLVDVLQKSRFWEFNSGILLNARQQMMTNKLLNGIEGKLTSSKWAKMAKCSQDTALRDIQDLISKEILIKDSTSGRSTSYQVVFR